MGLTTAIAGSLAIAAVSTLGDLVWATWITSHRAVYGLIHGALLFLAIGALLGFIAGRPAAGALLGACVGMLAAGLYYLLAPVLGFSAMVVSWMAVWLGLAVMYARLAAPRLAPRQRHDFHLNFTAMLGRGVIAAVASGLAFYAISGIWRPFDPQGWDYVIHFASWTFAYFAGLGPLLLRTRTSAIQ